LYDILVERVFMHVILTLFQVRWKFTDLSTTWQGFPARHIVHWASFDMVIAGLSRIRLPLIVV
jgi:hypothetical protein